METPSKDKGFRSTKTTSTESQKSYMCDTCGGAFNELSELEQHRNIHTQENPYTVEDSDCSNEDDIGIGKDEKPYTYPVSNDDQKKHVYILIHTGEKPLPYHASVKDHLKVNSVSHTSLKLFECHVCEKIFTKSYVYQRHVKTHSEERPFSCSYCEMRFKEKSHLKTHLNQHTGNRPYVCDICKLCFLHSAALQRHKLKHSGAKPFKCSACNKLFSRKDAFKIHMRTHSGVKPFACHICNKRFVRSNDLTRHLKIHTGEKPFTCPVCGKAFIRCSGLDRHLKIHTGEKTFTCNMCDQKFARKDALKTHENKHAKGLIQDTPNLSIAFILSDPSNPSKGPSNLPISMEQQRSDYEPNVLDQEGHEDANNTLPTSVSNQHLVSPDYKSMSDQLPVSPDISLSGNHPESTYGLDDLASTSPFTPDEHTSQESFINTTAVKNVFNSELPTQTRRKPTGQSRRSILKQFWTISKLQQLPSVTSKHSVPSPPSNCSTKQLTSNCSSAEIV